MFCFRFPRPLDPSCYLDASQGTYLLYRLPLAVMDRAGDQWGVIGVKISPS